MDEQMADDGQSVISLKRLSLMAGLSEELIVNELLLDDSVDKKGAMPLGVLREAMIKYLNRSIIVEKPALPQIEDTQTEH